MGLFKLAVYGGIGYLIYQVFFSDVPAASAAHPQAAQGAAGSSDATARNEGSSREEGRSRTATGQFTGRQRRGMDVQTQDHGGATVKHRVGRGVV